MKYKFIALLLAICAAITLVSCTGEEDTTETPSSIPEASGEIITVTNENFGNEVLKSKKTVLVDFWADWCGPCHMLAPTIDEIAKENPNVKVCKVNVDEEPELAEFFEVSGIPTLIVFKDGKAVDSSSGVIPKASILKMLDVD